MLFNSISFAVFLPVTFILYWMLSRHLKAQNALLLIASYLFYGWWDWRYLFLIAGYSAVNFIGGLLIYNLRGKFVRRFTLCVCCVVSLGVLGVFKYYNFFVESFSQMLSCVGIHWSPLVLNVMLPVGISFFTFQALSYTIDIALGKLKPTKSWVDFFVFISFFPQLVAGPIERATNLLPQFQRARLFDFDKATHGVCLIAYGLFKKMVVADALSQYVDQIWSAPALCSCVACAIGVIFFSVQIYCDFSGYSDVARGTAQLFGFELMLNFDRPYLSRTFAEFWRRWHISLSSWFKDYVYIPLGGNRVTLPLLIRNLWIVFLLSGLWHGAAWSFVVWGGLHAAFLTLGVVRKRFFPGLFPDSWITRVGAICFVDVGVAFAWIFFRSGTFWKSVEFLHSLVGSPCELTIYSLLGRFNALNFAFCLAAVFLLALSYVCPCDMAFKTVRSKFIFTICCVVSIVFMGMPPGGEFIYFKF